VYGVPVAIDGRFDSVIVPEKVTRIGDPEAGSASATTIRATRPAEFGFRNGAESGAVDEGEKCSILGIIKSHQYRPFYLVDLFL